MTPLCRVVVGLFALAWAMALAIFAIGTWGLFGAERDPLSGVFLVPLGMPWNMVWDNAPEALLPVIGIGAPAINLVVLWLVCRLLSRWRAARSNRN